VREREEKEKKENWICEIMFVREREERKSGKNGFANDFLFLVL